jgi:hypothetical protein
MIVLPPGATVSYNIRIIVSSVPKEMKEWWCMVGGRVEEIQEGRNHKMVPIYKQVLVFGTSKPSYQLKDGTKNTILTFDGKHATTASMFIIKFAEYIVGHNMKEYDNYEY